MFWKDRKANEYIRSIVDNDIKKVKRLIEEGFPKSGGCWRWYIPRGRGIAPPMYLPENELKVARQYGSWELIKYFLDKEHSSPDAYKQSIQESLTEAIRLGKVDQAKKYMEEGGDVKDSLDNDYFLYFENFAKIDEYCDFLFSLDLDWNISEPVTGNLLSFLIFSSVNYGTRYNHCIRGLLKKNIDINRLDNEGQSPLCQAIVAVRSQSGLNLEGENILKPTMEVMNDSKLWEGFLRKHYPELEIIFALLDAKANVNQRNANGKTPLSISEGRGEMKLERGGFVLDINEEIVRILKRRGARK